MAISSKRPASCPNVSSDDLRDSHVRSFRRAALDRNMGMCSPSASSSGCDGSYVLRGCERTGALENGRAERPSIGGSRPKSSSISSLVGETLVPLDASGCADSDTVLPRKYRTKNPRGGSLRCWMSESAGARPHDPPLRSGRLSSHFPLRVENRSETSTPSPGMQASTHALLLSMRRTLGTGAAPSRRNVARNRNAWFRAVGIGLSSCCRAPPWSSQESSAPNSTARPPLPPR